MKLYIGIILVSALLIVLNFIFAENYTSTAFWLRVMSSVTIIIAMAILLFYKKKN